MFNSIIGKSKGISKKFLCVLMTISLSLMMLPTSIFKTEANANPVTDSLPEKNGIVKSDSDMTKFGTFEYNASQQNGNVYTYTNNDLLNLITCKAESLESIQSSAEAEVKKALIDNGFTYIDGSWPAVDAGYTWDFTKIESVTSKLASLAVAPVVEKQNIENNLVDVVTGWNFATANPVSEVAGGQVDIKATYAKWVANYKVALKNKKNLALTPLTINTNLVTGSIALAPLPTNEVDTYGNPYYNVTVNLQIKNIAKELNTFNVSVKNIVTSTTNSNETNTPNSSNANSNINGGEIFAPDPVSTDKVYGDTLNFSGLRLFSSEEIDFDDYKFEASTNSPDYLNVAFDSENHEFSVTCKNSYSGGSALTAKLEAWDKDTANGEPLDTFTVTINKINKKYLGEVNLNTDIGDFPMMTLSDLNNEVSNKINAFYMDKWHDSFEGKDISISLKAVGTLFEKFDGKGTCWSGGTVTIDLAKLNLYIGDIPTENYFIKITEDSNVITINSPQACDGDEAYFCDENNVGADLKDVTNTWFGTEKVYVTSTNRKLVKFNKDKDPINDDFEEKISFESKKTVTQLSCKCFVQNSDTNILEIIDTKIKIDLDSPTYLSYHVSTNGEKGRDWEQIQDIPSFFNKIIDEVFNVIFTKQNFSVEFDISPSASPIINVKIYDGNKTDKHRNYIGQALYNEEAKKYILQINDDKEYDMDNWYVDIHNMAHIFDSTYYEYKVVNEGTVDEEITKIVKDSSDPEVSVGWYEHNEQGDIPFDPTENPNSIEDRFVEISVSDKFFNYSANAKKDVIALTVNITGINYETGSSESQTVYIKYGEFLPRNAGNYSIIFDTKDYSSGYSATVFVISISQITDILNRGMTEQMDSVQLVIAKKAPKLEIEWDTEDPPLNDKYFNHMRYANIKVTCCEQLFAKEMMGVYCKRDDAVSWNNDWSSKPEETNIYTTRLELKDEGIYLILVTSDKDGKNPGKDILDNKITQLKGTDSDFVIDWTKPKVIDLDISFTDTEKVVNDKYFPIEERKATVKVQEKYSWNPGTKNIQNSENKITLGSELKLQDDGKAGRYGLSEWTNEPDKDFKYSQTITFSGDGIYYLYINGKDLAGNPVEYNGATTSVEYIKLGQEFVLDKTDPIIENPKWNSATPKNEIYYNTGRSLYIEIKENNFEDDAHPNDFTPDVKVIDENGRDISSQAYTFSGWNKGTGATHYGNFNFVLEGDFTVIVDGKDLAYNDMNNPFNSGLFTQDWTAPTFTSITWDNDNVINGMYYSAARNVSISVYEHNFRASDFPITPSIIPGNDGTIGSFYIDQWADSNNYHNSGVSFPTEGNYTISVEGVDLAGNAIAPYVQSEFVLDWTKPTIQISGVENRQACGDVAQPRVVINDANMSTQTTCSVESLGITKGHPYSASPATTPAQFNYDYANPEKIADNDGVYRINVNAVDMAGNGDIQERVWSVNRFGSTYVIDADTESIMDGYVGKDKMKDIVVTEINPSGVDSHSVDLTKGSFTETLKEGSDYTTNATGGDGSWYECVYTISKNYFKEDGKYTLNYYSTDKAGNQNENTMDNKNTDRNSKVNIQFMYDNAKPSVSYDNLSDSMYSEAVHKATAVFEDNSKKFSEAKVIINGDEKYVSGDDLEKDKFKVNFELADSSTPYTIETVSIDKAGNEMNKDTKTVVVTMNPFLLWFYNTPLFIGSLIALGIVIAGLVFFLYRRKKLN